MGKRPKRVSTEGGQGIGNNPFGSLDLGNLPDGPKTVENEAVSPSPAKSVPKKSRGRVDIKRVKAGRGGKTVTVVSGFKGIANDEKLALAKSIQKRCGVGGAVKGGNIEIQGDKRDEAQEALESAGFRVVFAGG